jgi:hypothetical protein
MKVGGLRGDESPRKVALMFGKSEKDFNKAGTAEQDVCPTSRSMRTSLQ